MPYTKPIGTFSRNSKKLPIKATRRMVGALGNTNVCALGTRGPGLVVSLKGTLHEPLGFGCTREWGEGRGVQGGGGNGGAME